MLRNTNLIAMIPARGGSKGIPKKNVKICNLFSLLDKIFVKTKVSSSFNILTKSISKEK